MDDAIQRVSALEKAPVFSEPEDIYESRLDASRMSVIRGRQRLSWKGNECIYLSSHTSSGHFKKIVWKKGVGLMEYSAGQGAMADGYRLKRVTSKDR